MYRDYFSTDMENDPENDHFEDEMDQRQIAETGELNPNLYDFQDYTQKYGLHEDYNDIVEQKIFKYKYRMNADDMDTYMRRNSRMKMRMLERAKERDPVLEQNLHEIFQ